MTTIIGNSALALGSRSAVQAAAAQAAYVATQIGAATAGTADGSAAAVLAGAPPVSAVTPLLSSDVVGTLLADQAQQSTGTSASRATSDAPSGPLTLQQIADQFDVHHLTNTQFESLAKSLSAAGALPDSSLNTIAIKLGGGLENFDALEGKASSGPPKIVSTWDGVTDNTPPYGALGKVSGWLAADTSAGFSYAHADKNILDVLNQLSQLRSRATA
jgi:hypothetical protein